jgi:hypothetical protein
VGWGGWVGLAVVDGLGQGRGVGCAVGWLCGGMVQCTRVGLF